MLKLLLTHTPQMRQQYYGERALAGLRDLVEVHQHEGDEAPGAVQDMDLILGDRLTTGPGEIFAQLPALKATTLRPTIERLR
jgi:D-3-phosphoglycerate dehydrogenase / 2-oxoglutarate reductase